MSRDRLSCPYDGCPPTATLYRVNPTGEAGVFVCRTHWHLTNTALPPMWRYEEPAKA